MKLSRSTWPLQSLALVLLLGIVAPLHAEDAATAAPTAETAQTAPAAAQGFAAWVAALPEASYSEKADLVQQIAASGDPAAAPLLRALLENRLFSSTDGHVLISKTEGEPQALADAVSGEASNLSADDVKKVGTNNSLRKTLKAAIAQLSLSDKDAAVRLAAVREMMRSVDDESTAALRAHRETETDARVRSAIDIGLALADLASSDADTRLAAVKHLSGDISADAYNALLPLTSKNDDGSDVEPDARVRSAAQMAVRNIEGKRQIYGGIETLFFGLSLGSVLVLAAIGLAITFGVMGVINMAHGELIMLGAYTAYVMQQLMPQHIALATMLSIPAAFCVSGLMGVAIERGIVRFLYGRPLETLLATFGLSLILQQLVRSIFSPLNRSVATPEFMSGSLTINDALSLTYNRLYIVIFMFIVFAALLTLLKRTSLGLKVRAVSQNRAMARAMGVRTEWVDAATFGLGSGIAGVAGVALSQLTNVGPNLGQAYIIDSFMVVVFGGVGSLWGTLISGMSLGVVNKLLEPYAGAVMAKILVLVFLIMFIQKRPRGLFPQKGRAAEG
ncbi:urea ABC transporter permease subunit UrtB [Hydrocarboniphaga sp.]|uniref:urea ABC transporter permease subunit UrtB n=1 Tax=Hydrocarboniphaga sp. TaxID=2033016 RepID=UPI00260D9B24|nr:urea ABC transporter permease subunit UrtB [Hydrocarboniphaga sp.]